MTFIRLTVFFYEPEDPTQPFDLTQGFITLFREHFNEPIREHLPHLLVRSTMVTDVVLALFYDLNPKLLKVFTHYANLNQAEAETGEDSLDVKEFITICQDAHLLGGTKQRG